MIFVLACAAGSSVRSTKIVLETSATCSLLGDQGRFKVDHPPALSGFPIAIQQRRVSCPVEGVSAIAVWEYGDVSLEMERVHGRSIQYLWVYDGFSSEREIGGKREHLTKAGRDHQGLALWPGPSPSALRSRLAVVSCILTETASKARTASAPAELPLATHAKWGVWFLSARTTKNYRLTAAGDLHTGPEYELASQSSACFCAGRARAENGVTAHV